MQIVKITSAVLIIGAAIIGCKPSSYSRTSEGEDGSFSLSLNAVLQNNQVVATLTGNRAAEARVTNISLSDRLESYGAIGQNQAALVAPEFNFTVQVTNANCDIATARIGESKTVTCRNGDARPSVSPSPQALGYYTNSIPADFANLCRDRLKSTAVLDTGDGGENNTSRTAYCNCRAKPDAYSPVGSFFPIYFPNVVNAQGQLVVSKFDEYVARNCLVAADTDINQTNESKEFDARIAQFKDLCKNSDPNAMEKRADGSVCACMETGLTATADDFGKKKIGIEFFNSCKPEVQEPNSSATVKPTPSPTSTPTSNGTSTQATTTTTSP
jgi:hypothetical protein